MADIATEPKASTGTALISLLYVARGLRGFGDGFAIIILPAYMTALGYDAVAVGIVATASLLGTALLTLITGWIAPRHIKQRDQRSSGGSLGFSRDIGHSCVPVTARR